LFIKGGKGATAATSKEKGGSGVEEAARLISEKIKEALKDIAGSDEIKNKLDEMLAGFGGGKTETEENKGTDWLEIQREQRAAGKRLDKIRSQVRLKTENKEALMQKLAEETASLAKSIEELQEAEEAFTEAEKKMVEVSKKPSSMKTVEVRVSEITKDLEKQVLKLEEEEKDVDMKVVELKRQLGQQEEAKNNNAKRRSEIGLKRTTIEAEAEAEKAAAAKLLEEKIARDAAVVTAVLENGGALSGGGTTATEGR
jgi:chromosome segregation ATPase